MDPIGMGFEGIFSKILSTPGIAPNMQISKYKG